MTDIDNLRLLAAARAADDPMAAYALDGCADEIERLRVALREIVRMAGKGADAPMTAERWLDRIDEIAINALAQKDPD